MKTDRRKICLENYVNTYLLLLSFLFFAEEIGFYYSPINRVCGSFIFIIYGIKNYGSWRPQTANHKEYYRQKHNPDEYIAKLLYDYRNKLDGLHWKIRESGRPLDLYNNGYYIEEYQYDPCGNVIMEGNAWGTIDFTYNAANQLLQAGERTYSYDANGNLVKEGYKGDYVEYSYNYENRLISASNLSQNDKLFGGEHPFTGTITYTYDALGRRVGKELTPTTGNRVMVNGYYYDGIGTNILAEYEDEIWDLDQYRQGKKHTVGQIPGGQVSYFNEYYYGRGLIAFTNMNHPNPWYMQRDINFYHKDAQGSITAITDRHGNVTESYKYDVYGNPYAGRFLHMPKHNPYGFTGQRFEPELRMYSFAYRTYNPVSMRWMTEDPVKDGLNWYQYCNNNPVKYTDPTGLWVSNGDGTFIAESGDTLWELQQETGTNWHSFDYQGDPRNLQIGQTVGITVNKDTSGVIVDSNSAAVAHYYNGKGTSVTLGEKTTDALENNPDQLSRQERIVNGETSSLSGNYGVNMTGDMFHVGNTVVEYNTTYGTKYGVTTFTGFVRDGFWDVTPGQGDGLGPKCELPGGTPYAYEPYSWVIVYEKPCEGSN